MEDVAHSYWCIFKICVWVGVNGNLLVAMPTSGKHGLLTSCSISLRPLVLLESGALSDTNGVPPVDGDGSIGDVVVEAGPER